MKIYTKTGDKGTTSLVGGKRVKKSDLRLDAYGTIDELNSFVGLLDCSIKDESTKEFLHFIQNRLFNVGSNFATEAGMIEKYKIRTIISDDIERIELEIDKLSSKLPKLTNFVLPGGCESGSRAHICRTITRRAERVAYRLTETTEVNENVLRFLNRLSDYFFVLARTECLGKSKEIYAEI